MVAIKWGRGMSNAVDHRITSGTLVIESKGLLPFAFNTFKENKNKFVIFLKRKLKEQKRELRFAIGFGPPSQIFHRVPVFFFFYYYYSVLFISSLDLKPTHPPSSISTLDNTGWYRFSHRACRIRVQSATAAEQQKKSGATTDCYHTFSIIW